MNSHYSVLKKEALQYLNVKEGGVYVDATLGRGGHSEAILRGNPKRLYGFDLDAAAIAEVSNCLQDERLILIHENFRKMSKLISEPVDGILADLGVSSPQFDVAERGFSYRYDGPLDMRMDSAQTLDAYQIVNFYAQSELISILSKYGEEPFAKRIAQNICKERESKPIQTTQELVEIIKASLPAKVLAKQGHPAKRVFQALRIAVNDELGALEELLDTFPDLLKVEGRLVIISFHSLEDRLIKKRFKDLCTVEVDKRIPLLPDQIPEANFRLLSKKAILPSKAELQENRRSHSAKMRVIERIR